MEVLGARATSSSMPPGAASGRRSTRGSPPPTRCPGCSRPPACGPGPAPCSTPRPATTATSCTSASPIWVERVDRRPGRSRRDSPASRRGPRPRPPALDRRLKAERNWRLAGLQRTASDTGGRAGPSVTLQARLLTVSDRYSACPTRTSPPIWHQSRSVGMTVRAAPERVMCYRSWQWASRRARTLIVYVWAASIWCRGRPPALSLAGRYAGRARCGPEQARRVPVEAVAGNDPRATGC